MKYAALAGTNGWRDAWTQPDSDFGRMMTGQGFSVLTKRGRMYRWSTLLEGLFGDNRVWDSATDALEFFLDDVPYADRNLIGHSHGGQPCIKLAARGFPIRSLTTVGTPVRDDIPAAQAAEYIGYWQHIYDDCFDAWGWFGQFGDGHVIHGTRRFDVSGVVNRPVRGISHSLVLRDKGHLYHWTDDGWLDAIRFAPVEKASV